jgi:hypothetical protein
MEVVFRCMTYLGRVYRRLDACEFPCCHPKIVQLIDREGVKIIVRVYGILKCQCL